MTACAPPVVVIGGGIAGLVAAHELNRRGVAADVYEAGSRLAVQLGTTELQVNSRHHQAVDRVSPFLHAVAWHPETRHDSRALIEAIEARDPERWAFGIQWHPENLVGFENGAAEHG